MNYVQVDVHRCQLSDWLELPADLRGHWLAILVLAAAHEKSGAIPGAASWSSRRWRMECGFGVPTLKRLLRDGLASRSDSDIHASFYDLFAEKRAKQSRENARNAAIIRWADHAARIATRSAASNASDPVRSGPVLPTQASGSGSPPKAPPRGAAPAAPPAAPSTEHRFVGDEPYRQGRAAPANLRAAAASIAAAWAWGDAHVESIRRALWRLAKRRVQVDPAQVIEALGYAQKIGWRRRGANRVATAATFVRDQMHVELLEARDKARAITSTKTAAPAPELSEEDLRFRGLTPAEQLAELRKSKRRAAAG